MTESTTLEGMLAIFDMEPLDAARTRFAGDSGGGRGRRVVDGSQILAQCLVATVAAAQGGRTCASCTVLLDYPQPNVIRHDRWTGSPVAGPEAAFAAHMPLRGRELRIEGVRDHNSPDEMGTLRGLPFICGCADHATGWGHACGTVTVQTRTSP